MPVYFFRSEIAFAVAVSVNTCFALKISVPPEML